MRSLTYMAVVNILIGVESGVYCFTFRLLFLQNAMIFQGRIIWTRVPRPLSFWARYFGRFFPIVLRRKCSDIYPTQNLNHCWIRNDDFITSPRFSIEEHVLLFECPLQTGCFAFVRDKGNIGIVPDHFGQPSKMLVGAWPESKNLRVVSVVLHSSPRLHSSNFR